MSLHFKFFFNCAQILILLTQLTIFTSLETCRKLNSVCCNYLHFPLQSLVMSLKKKFPSLMSNNGPAINKDQIFDDEIGINGDLVESAESTSESD